MKPPNLPQILTLLVAAALFVATITSLSAQQYRGKKFAGKPRTVFFTSTLGSSRSETRLIAPSPGFIVGPALVTVFVKGIPSEADIVVVGNHPALLAREWLSIVFEAGGTRLRWREFSDGLFGLQYSDNLVSWGMLPGESRSMNSVLEFFDSTQPIPPRRFYRPVRVVP